MKLLMKELMLIKLILELLKQMIEKDLHQLKLNIGETPQMKLKEEDQLI